MCMNWCSGKPELVYDTFAATFLSATGTTLPKINIINFFSTLYHFARSGIAVCLEQHDRHPITQPANADYGLHITDKSLQL